jgi:hypothetical protein
LIYGKPLLALICLIVILGDAKSMQLNLNLTYILHIVYPFLISIQWDADGIMKGQGNELFK